MKKTLLYSTVAGLALLASACGTNTAENGTGNGTAGSAGTNAYDGGMFTRANNTADRGSLVGGYSGNLNRGAALGGTRTNNGTYAQNYSNGAYGTTNYNATGTGMTGAGGAGAGTGWFGTDNNNNRFELADIFGRDRDDADILGNNTNNNAYTNNGYGNNVRATDQANYRMNAPIYRQYAQGRTAGTLGTQGQGNGQGNGMTQMGYVKIDRNQMRTNSDTLNTVYVDRNALAQCVGNVTASVPGVNTSTVLVSDEEVFVGVTTQVKDKRTLLNRARMNAMSISPRYFKVYVTDNQSMINEMSRVASRGHDVNVQNPHNAQAVENLVKRFGGTPDGQDMRGRTTTGAGTNATNAGNQGSTTITPATPGGRTTTGQGGTDTSR